jgi:hypothetical protein
MMTKAVVPYTGSGGSIINFASQAGVNLDINGGLFYS